MNSTLKPKKRQKPRKVSPFAVKYFAATKQATYPLPTYSTPSPDPGVQSGWEVFSPPTSGTVSPAATPILTECTRKAGPNNLVLMTGYGMTSSTTFHFYGNSTLYKDSTQAKKMLLDNANGMASWVIPSNMSSGAVLVWPVTGGNIGKPLLLNTADVWHTQDMSTGFKDTAIPNATMRIYGMNLCNDISSTWVWVIATNGTRAGAWATVTACNEDYIEITVPTTAGAHGTLAVGDTLEIWVNNGRGRGMGWSKAPVNATVATLISLNRDYTQGTPQHISGPAGGSGPTSSADTTAIRAAVTGVQGNGDGKAVAITMGAGTYYWNSISFAASSGAPVSLEGAGSGTDPASNTIIKVVTSGYADNGHAAWIWFINGGRVKNIRFDTTALDTGSNGAVLCSNGDNAVVVNESSGTGIALNPSIGADNYEGGLWKNSTIQGYLPIYSNIMRQFVFDNLTLVVTDGYSDAALVCLGDLNHVTWKGGTVRQKAGTQNRGRLCAISGGCNYFHFANLDGSLPVPNFGTPPGADNGGEQLFIGEQSIGAFFNGTATSSSSGSTTTVTFPSSPPSAGQMVAVTWGKGVGQWGVVKSVSSNTATLDRKWSVDIDGTSFVKHGAGTCYGCIRDCVQAATGPYVYYDSSIGWQLYQLSANLHFYNNHTTGTKWGYSVAANDAGRGSNYFTAALWVLIEDTTLTDCFYHERWLTTESNGTATRIGVLARGTAATGPAGVTLASFDASDGALELKGHDNCSFADAPVGYSLTGATRDVLWNCNVVPGIATGTTHGTSGGSTTNLAVRGTNGIHGFTDHNIPATP